jgi:photosynthetic reaction center cytochrome c subunit
LSTAVSNRLLGFQEGDTPKVGCMTCHKGAYKPLYGVTMLNDCGELRGVVEERPAP